MEIVDSYQTIKQAVEGLYKEKGSKFFSFAYPVRSEIEVKEYIATLKKEHHSARHHCYAYRIGPSGEDYRMNDDGEPPGTAGRQIYGQLCSNNVSDVLLVVVRYFGGTLLGVSGLANAYKQASANALQNAEIVIRTIEEKYTLEFDYTLQNTVNRIIKDCNASILKENYGINCKYLISVKLTMVNETISILNEVDGLIVKYRKE
ncbi:MAG: YigZ family protein [Prolixibacteraceae bacterium]|nr:YigZ family protein [Prolixibacteraceae bacterium]